MDIINYILIGGSFLFSLFMTITIYGKEKYNLISLSRKLKNGWGLYLVTLSKHENNIIESPIDGEEYLYYSADIHFEEQVITEKEGKKKDKQKVDIKFYPGNDEKTIENKFIINLFSRELVVNSKNININVDPVITTDVKLKLDDNKKIMYMNEKYLKQNKKYYLLIEFKNKKPNMKTLSISDKNDNFKNGFYFKMFIIWFPTIMFTSSFFLL